MVHRLRQVEDGLALVFDPSELEAAGIGPDTPVTVSARGRQIVVEAAECSEEFEEALEEFNRRYKNMLRRLAE